MRVFGVVLGFAMGALLWAAPVWAEPHALRMRLGIDACEHVDRAEVERVLAAELGAELTTDEGSDVTEVSASCDAGRLVLEVADPVSRKILKRRFDLGSVPEPGQSRLVAVAASELVFASWAELELNPQLRVQPEGPAPEPAAAVAARERLRLRAPTGPVQAETVEERSEPQPDAEDRAGRDSVFAPRSPEDRALRIVPLASMRRFLKHDGTLWGGGLRAGSEPLPATSWAADVMYEQGTLRRGNEDFRVKSWTLGGQVLLSGGAGPFTGRAGGGLRVGMVGSEGVTSSGGTVIAAWGWPFAAVSGSVRGGRTLLELSGEGGYVVLPLSQSSDGPKLAGIWVSAQLGFGIIP